MRRRIVVSTALIALAAVTILGVPLGVVEGRRVRADATARLEREADAVGAAVDDRVEAGRPLTGTALAPLVRSGHGVEVLAPDGTRTFIGARPRGGALTQRSGAAQPARVTAFAPRAETDRRVRAVWLLIAGLGVGGVAAATALAALQARRLAAPLETVAGTSRRLGGGDFSARAGRFGIPEIDAVAEALDSSAERIAETVAREREFSSNVSHQLRTPLTALRLRLEEVAALDDPAARRVEADLALAEADRLEATIGALLSHARTEAADPPVALDLDALVREHGARFRSPLTAQGRGLELALGLGDRATRSSPAVAGQVVDVLLENALRHGAGNGPRRDPGQRPAGVPGRRGRGDGCSARCGRRLRARDLPRRRLGHRPAPRAGAGADARWPARPRPRRAAALRAAPSARGLGARAAARA